MTLFDVAQLILNVQNPNPAFSGCGPGVLCPASAYTVLGAAYSTLGYWLQADIIHYLLYTGLGLWAPLLYVFAAVGGIVGVAIGMPPRTYMWFFLGPGLYHWLIATTVHVHGVEWRVGRRLLDQRQVWKQTEVGLANSNIVRRISSISGTPIVISRDDAPSQPVEVASVFVMFDRLVSSTVENLIDFTGVHRQFGSERFASNDTNLPERGDAATPGGRGAPVDWQMLSTLKWELVQDVTQATLHSPGMRDAFITFMGGSCGDGLAQLVQADQLVAASHSKGFNLPETVFGSSYAQASAALEGIVTPVSPSLLTVLTRQANTTGPTGFSAFFDQSDLQAIIEALQNKDAVNCNQFFYLIMNGFRWEAGQIYHQIVNARKGVAVPAAQLLFSLFYGWDIKACGAGGGGVAVSACPDASKTEPLTGEQQVRYMQDLILLYLIRNEMRLAPKVLSNTQYTSSADLQRYVLSNQRTVGQSTKFGELFAWARMVPHIQGVLLYLLAAAYPLACLLIVVPGWHKTVFTWASFWAWAKMWDFGFALVTVVDRSVWAMLGNNAEARNIANKVVDMQYWANIDVVCTGAAPCPVPRVCDISCPGTGFTGISDLLRLFDRALVLSGNLDLDLTNANYLFIVAALYLSVPAVTGQLILGARAGAAGMINSMIGGVSSEAGRAASGGFTGQMTQHAKSAAAAVSQAGYVASASEVDPSNPTAGSLTDQFLRTGNKATTEEAAGGMSGAAREAAQVISATRDLGKDAAVRDMSLAKDLLGDPAMQSVLGGAVKGAHGRADNLIRQSNNPHAKPVFDALGRGLGWAVGAGDPSKKTPPPGNGQTGGESEGGRGAGKAPYRSALDLAGALATWNNDMAFNTDQAAANKQRVTSALSAGDGNVQAMGHRLNAQRLGEHGQFRAEMGGWARRNDYANQISGDLAAMGVSPGVADPGSKPNSLNGMAMSGMLGSDAKGLARFAQPGGNFDQMFQEMSNTNWQNFGPQRVDEMYRPQGPVDTLLNNAAAGTMNLVSGGYEPNSWNGASKNFADTMNASGTRASDSYANPSGHFMPTQTPGDGGGAKSKQNASQNNDLYSSKIRSSVNDAQRKMEPTPK